MNDIGLPEAATFNVLLYNEPSDVLVAAMTVGDGLATREKLFLRDATEDNYHELPYPDDPLLTYRDPVVASNAPMLFFLQWRSSGAGFDWDAVLVYDLLREELATVCDKSSLMPPLDAVRIWIARLHGVNGVGDSVVCTVATECMKRNGVGTRVKYELAMLDVQHCGLRPVTELSGSYF
jgi:hypothetical protein